MNKTTNEAIKLVTEIKREVYNINELDIVICPPFTALGGVQEALADSNIYIGAQDMYFEDEGAFTGEVSALMLKELGCHYVIVGHSERRRLFFETDENINKKVKAALKYNLIPILCIGETLEEREENKTFKVLQNQLKIDLEEINSEDIAKVVIAYEPIWAIGTGRNATNQQAQSAHAFIREQLSKKFNEDISQNLKVIYGGSVKPDNIEGLIKEPDVDGALVGGASLDAASFAKIIKNLIKESS